MNKIQKIFYLFLLMVLTVSLSANAQVPIGDTDDIQPNSLIVTPSHVGSSPIHPPESNDATFVVDQDIGLDTGCTFRSGGP